MLLTHSAKSVLRAAKVARICNATLRDKVPFGERQRLSKQVNRESFVMPT